MCVSRRRALVNLRPGEGRDGEDVDIVVQFVGAPAAVEVDVVAGVVFCGGCHDAELGSAVGDIAAGELRVPGAGFTRVVEGGDVEEIDFVEWHIRAWV